MKRPTPVRPVVLALALFAVPCSAGLFDLSESRERKIGREMMDRLLEEYAYYSDWQIDGIGQLLREASGSPEWVADFHVLPDPQVNAFAMPGGHIMIAEGLLDILETEDEIAFVLAHEIGHAVKRHIAAQYKRYSENSMLFTVVLAALGAGRGWWDVGDLLQSITMNQYSQKKEREADIVGYQLTARIGYNPEAAISALEKLRQGRKDGSKTLNKLFGSHPLISERVHRLDFLPDEIAPERPVIEPPIGAFTQAKIQIEYLNHDDTPWEDQWAVAIANRVASNLLQASDVAFVRKWQTRRDLDQPDYKVVVHRRLVKKGKHTDATLEVDIFDLHEDVKVSNKYYATRPISEPNARVDSYSNEVSEDIAKFLESVRE